jgi:hypothetical protein
MKYIALLIASVASVSALACADLSAEEIAEMESSLSTPPTKAQIDAYMRIHGYSSSSFPAAEGPNGCGAQGGVPVPDRVYTSACNAHDLCYSTLSSYSAKTRADCDSAMLSAMKSACQDAYPGTGTLGYNWLQRHECYKQADVYYEAVRRFGGDAWSAAQSKAQRYMTAVNTFKSNWTQANWDTWLDRDDPTGNGDGEWLNAHVAEGNTCSAPLAVQCRVKTGSGAGNNLSVTLADGCHCENSGGTPCADYEVRFLCK